MATNANLKSNSRILFRESNQEFLNVFFGLLMPTSRKSRFELRRHFEWSRISCRGRIAMRFLSRRFGRKFLRVMADSSRPFQTDARSTKLPLCSWRFDAPDRNVRVRVIYNLSSKKTDLKWYSTLNHKSRSMDYSDFDKALSSSTETNSLSCFGWPPWAVKQPSFVITLLAALIRCGSLPCETESAAWRLPQT